MEVCLLTIMWEDLQSYTKGSFFCKLTEELPVWHALQCSVLLLNTNNKILNFLQQCSVPCHQTWKIADQVGVIKGEGLNIWILLFYSSNFSSFFHHPSFHFNIVLGRFLFYFSSRVTVAWQQLYVCLILSSAIS